MGYPDAAFRGLYAEYSPAVLRLATLLTGGDRGRAADLIQLAPQSHPNATRVGHWIGRISLPVLYEEKVSMNSLKVD